MDKRHNKHVMKGVAGLLTTGLLALPVAHAATINQTVIDTGGGWNSSLWGSPAAAPTSGNDYVTASGLVASNPTRLGVDVTGRVRFIAGQTTFGGNSITVSTGTEILGKDAGTYTANIILNGGIIRHSPNTAANATLAGTIDVAANSVLGSVQSGTQVFTVASTITGSATLRLAGGTAANQTITFDDSVGTSLNDFAGTLDIGGGQTNQGGANRVTVDFNQAYNMALAGMAMGNYATADVLNLDANISVARFSFNGTGLANGTYDIATLNATFGDGSQFTGTGTLTVTGTADQDGDGLPDSFEDEIINFDELDAVDGYDDVAGPNDAPTTTDFDSDGLSDADEFLTGTNPTDPDSDSDGLLDGAEVDGTDNDGVSHGFGPTDPLDADSDDDGLNDGAEIEGTDNNGIPHGFDPTDPLFADSDGDTLLDGAEVAGTDNNGDPHTFGPTDPNYYDSDNDFLPDDWEIQYDLNPNSDAGTDGETGNPDEDGLENHDEYLNGTDPQNADSDGDGLKDGPEVEGTDNAGNDTGFGPTDPTKADSDDDGFSDWFEVRVGSNSNDISIVPTGTAVPLVNGGFEDPAVATTIGVPVSGGTVTGWSVIENDFYVIDTFSFANDIGTPSAASEGLQFATPDRRAPDPDVDAATFGGGIDATMSLRQDIDVTSLSSEIDAGARSLLLAFDWFDNDVSDEGVVTLNFLDGSNANLGRQVSFRTGTTAGTQWQKAVLSSYPPAGTRVVRITIEAVKIEANTSTVRNVHFDNFSAQVFHLDGDSDEMADDWELANGLNPDSSADAAVSADGDTLTNLQEFQYGTNPNAEDTDGDDYNDDEEINAGSDPLDDASIPSVVTPADIHIANTTVTTDGSGQVTQVQVTFSGLDTSKTYALKRGTDLITFPDTVDIHQPSSETEAFTDSSPVSSATSGKAFYILVDGP